MASKMNLMQPSILRMRRDLLPYIAMKQFILNILIINLDLLKICILLLDLEKIDILQRETKQPKELQLHINLIIIQKSDHPTEPE